MIKTSLTLAGAAVTALALAACQPANEEEDAMQGETSTMESMPPADAGTTGATGTTGSTGATAGSTDATGTGTMTTDGATGGTNGTDGGTMDGDDHAPTSPPQQ